LTVVMKFVGQELNMKVNIWRERLVTFNRVAGDTLAILLIFGMGFAALVMF